ncbi:hypothetical protein B566_EDAN009527 [Ephemera danica]|nr:hypothetical protein B566_EDAN009527 [Ephemera danica]
MLEPLKHILQARRIILASSSPRRREVLENIALALGKAKEVADRIEFSPQNPGLIVGADTVVILDSKILGKPASKNIAKQMLQSFSGRSHFVYTGIALITAEKTVTFHEKTEVHMAELTEEVIDAYVNTGEPMDKAGGYGIQGVGGTLVRSVVGDYFNVVGFPLHRFCSALVELYQQR